MSFGERLLHDMTAEAKRLGRKLDGREFVVLSDRVFADYVRESKRKPKAAGRARNPLFDALALAMCCQDLSQITRNGAKSIGVALADIMAVCPELTPEEIQRRAAAYKRKWPDSRNHTATALAKYWHEFGQSQEQRTRASKTDPYQRPAGDWKAVLLSKYAGSPLAEDIAAGVKDWTDVPLDARTAILKAML